MWYRVMSYLIQQCLRMIAMVSAWVGEPRLGWLSNQERPELSKLAVTSWWYCIMCKSSPVFLLSFLQNCKKNLGRYEGKEPFIESWRWCIWVTEWVWYRMKADVCHICPHTCVCNGQLWNHKTKFYVCCYYMYVGALQHVHVPYVRRGNHSSHPGNSEAVQLHAYPHWSWSIWEGTLQVCSRVI